MNSETRAFKYLAGYSEEIQSKVAQLVDGGELNQLLLRKYPAPHDVRTDAALYAFTMQIKNDYLRKSQPIAKVIFDPAITDVNRALGLHSFVSRVQGAKLKAKHEIRVASIFKTAPVEFLRMIVVHELAHLKEKEHNKAFYNLCEHMEPDYHQLEFDTRLYLTHLDVAGPLYPG
ncbi:hypothetical protein GMSM_10290 [Geomonas sp. Red276]